MEIWRYTQKVFWLCGLNRFSISHYNNNKTTFTMSVCLSTCMSFRAHLQIFMKFDIAEFRSDLSICSSFCLRHRKLALTDTNWHFACDSVCAVRQASTYRSEKFIERSLVLGFHKVLSISPSFLSFNIWCLFKTPETRSSMKFARNFFVINGTLTGFACCWKELKELRLPLVSYYEL